MSKKLTPKQIRCKSIESLVDSLGFKLVRFKKSSSSSINRESMLEIKDKKTGHEVQCYVDDAPSFFHYSVFYSYDNLEQDLFNTIKCFAVYVPKHRIDNVIYNPYYGCRSLEEALIKKDLLENDARQHIDVKEDLA